MHLEEGKNSTSFWFWSTPGLLALICCFYLLDSKVELVYGQRAKVKVLVTQSFLTLCNPMDCSPLRLLCPWDSPGKNTGVGCHFLLQGIFPTQGSNLGLPHCRQILYGQRLGLGKSVLEMVKYQHNVLLKQPNSLPLTKWKEEGKGGRKKSWRRERGKGRREGEGICLFAFVYNQKNQFDKFYRNACDLFLV